jgi:hypothetical protein
MRAIIVTASIIVLSATALDRADADPAADQAIQEKIAPIIDCINNSDFRLQRTFQAYRRTLDDIKRTGSASFVGGFEDMDTRFANSLKCADGLDQAVKAAPKIEDIDHAASEYATAIREFAPIGVEADRYYSQNDYIAEAYAGTHDSELHPSPILIPSAWASMENDAGFFLRDLKELRRALESAKPSPTQLQRDYQSLVRSFNNLVNGYNNSRS